MSRSTQAAFFLSKDATIQTHTGPHYGATAFDVELYLSIYVDQHSRDTVHEFASALLTAVATYDANTTPEPTK
jgi:hypothetical protein